MLRKTLKPIEDDTEQAPWMVMGPPQFNAVTAFYDSLRVEIQSRPSKLFVAAMLPIRFRPAPGARVEQLAPDTLAAPVPDHPRASYVVEREGAPPAFVLDVVSPESESRDLEIKPERYERMRVMEYALFAPPTLEGLVLLDPPLQGYRLPPAGDEYVPWEPDADGRLYSEVLDLWLVVHEGELRVQQTDGSWLPTLQEETACRAAAERELERLRAKLEEFRGRQD
jgi:Uma2 family endonuclease